MYEKYTVLISKINETGKKILKEHHSGKSLHQSSWLNLHKMDTLPEERNKMPVETSICLP